METRDLGLFVVRTSVGVTLAAHGTQKLFGWFGGPGMSGATKGFERMGFEPPREMATVAAVTETVAGALLAAGLATPIAGAAAAGTMTVAASVHEPKGFFAANGGMEHPLLLAASSAALALTGPGKLSFSQRRDGRSGLLGLLALGVGLAAAAVVIGQRKAAMAKPETEIDLAPHGDARDRSRQPPAATAS